MALNVLAGVSRSGKSYEAVIRFIVPNAAQGVRVVTNIPIYPEKITDYLEANYPDVEQFGELVVVTSKQVGQDNFFCTIDEDGSTVHCDGTIVQPGDLVVIDEAWKIWPDNNSLTPGQRNFLREHGHMVDPVSHRYCNLIILTQHVSDLCTFLRRNIHSLQETVRPTMFGETKYYYVVQYSGRVASEKCETDRHKQFYKDEVFALYKSASHGKIKNTETDSRRLFFSKRSRVAMMLAVPVLCIFALVKLYSFFFKSKSETTAATSGSVVPGVIPGIPGAPGVTKSTAVLDPTPETWKLSGYLSGKDGMVMVAYGGVGQARYIVNPSQVFIGRYDSNVIIDGHIVTPYSGGKSKGLLQ